MKYRKKPVVIEAFQWTGDADQTDDPVWIVDAMRKRWGNPGSVRFASGRLEIMTLEGVMTARSGDYVIQGIQGEIYPCKADIFEATYEPAVEES
ncbi:MAG: hypothetical protein ABIK85_08620 [Candidatus Eisenbacteria bacterium]